MDKSWRSRGQSRDSPSLQCNDLIALFGDGGAMGDEEHGLVGIGGEETAVEFALRGFVERAADLVEQ